MKHLFSQSIRLLVLGTILLLYASCENASEDFRKYDIESGIATYTYGVPSLVNPTNQRIYFSNYGATEYIEFEHMQGRPNFPILKIDSLEYTLVGDSMAITTPRTPTTIFEKLITRKNSKLRFEELTILNRSDTLIMNRPYELIDFEISPGGMKGQAALWKGIPLWASCQWESGLMETLMLTDLDVETAIPVAKRSLMPYMDVE